MDPGVQLKMGGGGWGWSARKILKMSPTMVGRGRKFWHSRCSKTVFSVFSDINNNNYSMKFSLKVDKNVLKYDNNLKIINHFL